MISHLIGCHVDNIATSFTNLAPGEECDCDPDAEREEGEGDDDGEEAAVGPAARAVELEVREVRSEPRLAERLNLQSKEVFEESV